MNYISVLFGFVLGLVGSLFKEWYTKTQKIDNFLKGLIIVFHEILLCAVENSVKLKMAIGELDQDYLIWGNKILLFTGNSSADVNMIIKEYITKNNTKLRPINKEISIKDNYEITLNKYNDIYMGINLEKLTDLDSNNAIQNILFKIYNRLLLLNHKIDRYGVFIDNVLYHAHQFNESILPRHKILLKEICNYSILVADDMLEAIKLLDKLQPKNIYNKFINLINLYRRS